MRNEIKKALDHLKSSSTKEKVMTIGVTSISVIFACMAVKLAAPVLATLAIAYFFLHKDNTSQRQQQAIYQQEQLMELMRLYEQVARMFFPIIKEYSAILGIELSTVHSLYSDKKFIYLPNIPVPVLVYIAEKKYSPMLKMSEVKPSMQKRFNQERLDLYLVDIDDRDPYYFKFYILPINSKEAYDWAKADWQRRFNNTRPQKPGNRKDKDF